MNAGYLMQLLASLHNQLASVCNNQNPVALFFCKRGDMIEHDRLSTTCWAL
jgi:hypothetical protein